jgi:YVTN family beta-propeller protein
MRKKYFPNPFLLLPVLLFLAGSRVCAQVSLEQLEEKKITLPNGWALTPVGKTIPLGDLPLNITFSASERYMAVTNNGQSTQSIQLIDVKNEKILDEVTIPKSWLGLKFSANEKWLYASGGNDNWILKYALINNRLTLADSIKLGRKWPTKISPAGIEINDPAHALYVVTKEDSALYVIDLNNKKLLHRLPLGAEAYTCLLSADRKELYISLWGGDKVLVYNIRQNKILFRISVGDNPNDLCATGNGRYLFVANANDNSVTVIDIRLKKVIETLNTALFPNSPTGSTTNSVALSADEKTLYIANADNNCLAVFDVSHPGKSRSRGFIPVGWYPTCVRTKGSRIYVANGKGFTSMANPNGPNPVETDQQTKYKEGDKSKPLELQYIGGLFKGALSIIPVPDEKELAIYSQAVYHNTPYNKQIEQMPEGEKGNPIPLKPGLETPIKYVFYVLKENRTYDQVLGDMSSGNGDSSLCLFPRHITPNQHALADQFVLLDNFYVNAEVSADGHNWSMAAYANDYVEKTWPTSYGDRGGTYDYAGNRKIAFPKNGFIWDLCIRNHVSMRNYGEFSDDGKPHLPGLAKNTCASYPGWDLSFRDIDREKIWERDFDSLLSLNKIPRFNLVYLPNDHTSGLEKGAYTPFAAVADNDLALGRLVDHLSKSPIWKESVVFVVEDDAQNGPDHVDAHRSIAFVAGPIVKRHYVDHTMYSTTSMLRTIELILGVPPMSQYDAAATPMWRSFTSGADLASFDHLPPGVNIDERNTATNEYSRQSMAFDLRKEDNVPDILFNEVLWHAIKGQSTPYPAPRRGAFLLQHHSEEDDGE